MFQLVPTAQASAANACALVPGGCAVSADGLANIILLLANGMVTVVGALCVLFIIWGGMLMAFSGGEDGKITKGKESITYAAIGLVVTLLAQSIVNYFTLRAGEVRAGAAGNLILNAIGVAIAQLLYIFNAGIVIVIIIAGFKYVLSRGADDQAKSAVSMITWAVIGGIVINAARLLAELIINSGL